MGMSIPLDQEWWVSGTTQRDKRKGNEWPLNVFIFDLVSDFTGKAKWDAWKKNEGLSQEEAKQKYVDALLAIFEKSGEFEDKMKKEWKKKRVSEMLRSMLTIHSLWFSDEEEAKKWTEEIKSAK